MMKSIFLEINITINDNANSEIQQQIVDAGGV